MNLSVQTKKVLHVHAQPGVLWLQDGGRVLVVNQQSQVAHWLDGDAALIWSWLNSGVSFSNCVTLLATLNNEEPSKAMSTHISRLSAWQESGIVHSETEE